MYPCEITSTSVWIRHNLPLGPSPPPNGDRQLRQQIRSKNVNSTDEVIEQYVRQERSRLDLKWCLDQYFGWNVSDPYLGQMVTANIVGLVHLAYIIEINDENLVLIPTDMLGSSVVVGFDDIYSAEDGPFYEKFLLNHGRLHSQHVLDYIANRKSQDKFIRFGYKDSYDMVMMESACEHPEIEWPEGDEMWLFHDELPQRTQFIQYRQQLIPATSTSSIVENPIQQMATDCDCVVSSTTQQHNENTVSQQSLLTIVSLLESTPPIVTDTEPRFKKQAVKEVQFQKITQLVNHNLSSEFYSQYELIRIGDYNHECGHSNIKTSSLQPTLIYTILTLFILINMAFKFLSSYLNIRGDKNTSYFDNHMLFHSVNDLDWFRTLAVP